MKRNSLQLPAFFYSLGTNYSKSVRKTLMVILFCLAGYSGFSAVTVVPGSSGSSICGTVATSANNVGTITITEGATNDFPSGASQIVLAPPAGWSFVTTLPTITATGGDVTIGVISISPTALTINFNASGTTHIDAVTIAGLQVTAASSGSSSGNVFAQSDLGVVGISTGTAGTNFGTLAIVTAVTPSVVVTGAPPGTICAGTGVTFTPTPTNGGASPTFQWFVNGSSVGTSPFYASSTLSNGNTVNCIMTATAGGCYTTGTATSNVITMSVNPAPAAVTVTGGGTSCGTTTLVASNGGSGTIYFQGTTSGGTSTSIPASSEVITTSGTYYFNAQTAAGCWGTQGSAIVVISSLPSAVTVTGGGTFCGGTTTLNASNLGDGTIYYQGITSNGTSTAAPSTSQLETTSGTYYFRAQSASGCWGTQGSQVVTINAIPTAVTVSGGGSFCGSTTITAANGGSGTIYYQGTTSGGTSIATPSASQLISASGTYYFNAQSAAGCWGTQGSTAVTISTAPTVNAGLPQSICAGSSATLAGSIGGSASTVTWSAPSGTFSNVNSLTSTYTPSIVSGSVTLTLTTNAGPAPCLAASSTVVITVNAQPTVVTVTGAGTACGSATLTAANGGSGIIYYQGSTSNGTSVATPSVSQTVSATGTYYFRAQSGGCWGPQGSAAVTVNPTPNAYTVTGGGGYCTGSTGSDIGLSNSDAGVTYQLQRGGVNVGLPVAGTNAALDFGLQTIAGTYTVVGSSPTTTCTVNMAGSGIVSINALPTQYTMTGSGSFCSGATGVAVGLTGSAIGSTYQLKLGGLPVGTPVTGTGVPITFGTEIAGGTYTATATITATGCTQNMLGTATLTVNPSPTTFSVTGGGAYCTGGTGLLVGLAGSTLGVSYQLYKGLLPSGVALTGTGSAISFGLQTSAASYTVVATNTTTLCTSTMTGSATITITAPPTAFPVTGGGSFCSGGTGADVGLGGSTVGNDYQLYVGGTATGIPATGTGSAIDFGLQTTGGTYTVIATNVATGCIGTMTGSVLVTVNPTPTTYTITGGGSYCTGGAGLAVGLSGSQTGVTYQLYNSFAPTGSPIAGTGSALSFGTQTVAGFYTVVATNTATGCTNNMTSGVAITILPLPIAYTMTGGGGYCAGGTGSDIGLSGSDVGVNYLLYRGVVPIGTPVTGTGSALDFGLQTTGGTYTAIATNTSTTCVNNMAGSVTVTVNPLPALVTVTGGGAYCTGGTGVPVGLSGSATGINYQLFDGASASGTAVAGTGATLSFGSLTAIGTYSVVATDATTGCTRNMTGTVSITTNPIPAIVSVTGGGTECAGGAGFPIGVGSSTAGINYDLYLGASLLSTIAGTGSSASFGTMTSAGTYKVVGTDATTGCEDTMGSAVITIISLPTVYTLTGGGGYCAGAAGVDIMLGGSDLGTSYQLSVGGSPVGSPITGTGSTIDFGMQTTAGTYTCQATTAIGGCTNTMSGGPIVTITPAPAIFTVTGGGPYCAGSTGSDIGLSSSAIGVNYQLLNGSTPVGAALAGTGSPLDYGLITTAGTYNIVASTASLSCSATMAGPVTITISTYPVVAAIAGPTHVCDASTIVLTDDSTGGVWSTGTPATGVVDASGNMTGVATGTATISYTITNATGCATSVSTTITVQATPVVTGIVGTSSVCIGATAGLADVTTGGNWSSSAPTVATVGSTGTITGITSGTATISYTVTSGGCSASATSSISVGGGIPASAILPAGSATLCNGLPVGLRVTTAGSPSGLSYQWYMGSSPVTGAVDSTDTVSAPGVYSCTISNGTCSETLTAVNIVAPPAPVISLDTIPNLLFTGSFVTYQWLLNGAVIPGATSNNTPQQLPLGNTYRVVVSDANGCFDTSAAFTVIDSALVGVKPVSFAKDIRIYPNPATSVIHIDAPVRVFVSVLSPEGSVLIDRKEAISINVGELADGLYMIMVYDENNNLVKAEKFVKMQ